jgi:hypothetical protein
MPALFAPQTKCPRCRRVGLVRAETIVRGGRTIWSFYCGGCQHEWRMTTEIDDSEPPPPKPRKR